MIPEKELYNKFKRSILKQSNPDLYVINRKWLLLRTDGMVYYSRQVEFFTGNIFECVVNYKTYNLGFVRLYSND